MNANHQNDSYDVAVIGLGPIGLTLATLLALKVFGLLQSIQIGWFASIHVRPILTMKRCERSRPLEQMPWNPNSCA